MVDKRKDIILSMPEFFVLKNHFFPGEMPEVIIEYFYDTKDYEMKRIGITACIIEKDECCLACIMEHQKEWNEYSIINTVPVNNRSDDEVFTEIGLVCQGKMTTIRYNKRLSEYEEIFLDQNVYFGKTDYEIEVVYKDGFEKHISSEIICYAVHLFREGVNNSIDCFTERLKKRNSKSQRFFERKAKTNGGIAL